MTTNIIQDLSSSFQINCQMEGTFTVAQEWAIAAAVKTWETIITADIPDLLLPERLAKVTYRGTTYSVDPNIDDVTIVFVGFSQGPNAEGTTVVGSSTVSTVRVGSALPCVSAVGINNQAISDNWLDVYWLYMHEICHALGFYSVIWETAHRDDGPLSENALWNERYNGTPMYFGEKALAEYQKTHPDATYVPLETILLSGSYGTHFLGSEFTDKVNKIIDFMAYNSGNASGSGWDVTISSVVLGAMQDLGYTIEYNAAYQPDLPDFYMTLDVLHNGAATELFYTGVAYEASFTIINTTGKTIVGAELVFSINGVEQKQLLSVLEANEAATVTVTFTSQSAGSITLAGTVSSMDGKYSSSLTDTRYFDAVNRVNNNTDSVTTVGSFRWALATLPNDTEIVFDAKYNITIVNGILAIANRAINGTGSGLYSDSADTTIRLSGKTTIQALSIANRYTGTDSFLAAGSEVVFKNVSYSSKQSNLLLAGKSLTLDHSVIAGDTIGDCTITINTALTLAGGGNTFFGNFNQTGGTLTLSPDLTVADTTLLSISGKILSVGNLFLNCSGDLVIGTTYRLVSVENGSFFDGKSVTLNGAQTLTVNGARLDFGGYSLALASAPRELSLMVIDNLPAGAVRIAELPDFWLDETTVKPVFAWDLQNHSGSSFYNGTNGSLNTVGTKTSRATRISGNGLGTVFGGGTTAAIDSELYLLIAGVIGTVFGGGDGNDGTTNKTLISMESGAKIYTLFGGGRESDGQMTTISIAAGTVNYLFGGGYRCQLTEGTKSGDAFAGAVTIRMDGGSIWKFFGGAADGTINGDIDITVAAGAITNVFYGGGIGDVTGNIIVKFEKNADLSAAPVLYGGVQVGVAAAITSAGAELPQLTSRGDRDYTVGKAISITFTETRINGMVIGGNFVNADGSGGTRSGAVKGGVAIQLDNAVADSWIFGGSYVKSAFSKDIISSEVKLKITGGDYHYIVGGSRAENGGTATVAHVQIAISGGNFQSILLAGGYANVGTSIVTGNTQLTIDTSTAEATFGNSLYLGGYANTTTSSATIDGTTTAVFTGQGTRLHFNGSISGSGFGKGNAAVAGKKTIEFNNFIGDFNGVMREFDRLVLSGDTSANFTAEIVPELFSEWYFDLAKRISRNAVATIRNSAELSLCRADTVRTISVAVKWIGDTGTIVLIDAVDNLLADLNGMEFRLLFQTGGGMVLDELLKVNDAAGIELGSTNWQLTCDGNVLSLQWETPTASLTTWEEPALQNDTTATLLPGPELFTNRTDLLA